MTDGLEAELSGRPSRVRAGAGASWGASRTTHPRVRACATWGAMTW